jgi:hypothetical protein
MSRACRGISERRAHGRALTERACAIGCGIAGDRGGIVGIVGSAKKPSILSLSKGLTDQDAVQVKAETARAGGRALESLRWSVTRPEQTSS